MARLTVFVLGSRRIVGPGVRITVDSEGRVHLLYEATARQLRFQFPGGSPNTYFLCVTDDLSTRLADARVALASLGLVDNCTIYLVEEGAGASTGRQCPSARAICVPHMVLSQRMRATSLPTSRVSQQEHRLKQVSDRPNSATAP